MLTHAPQLDHHDRPAVWVDPSALDEVCGDDQAARHALVAVFMDASRQSVAKLGVVVAVHHGPTVKSLAHEIQGRAAVVGARAMAAAASHVAAAAEAGDWNHAVLQQATLERSFEMACAELDAGRAAGSTMRRLMIADDDPVVRMALCHALSDEFDVVGTAADAVEAIALAERTRPDAAIVDLQMPDGGGLRATREIRRRVPETAIVVLSADECEPIVLATLEAGAMAYVRKGLSAHALMRTLHASIAARTSQPQPELAA